MKRLLLFIVTLIALSGAGFACAADGIKLGSVDLNKIAKESKEGVEVNKSLTKLAETLKKNLKTKEAELDKLKAALEGQGKQLTPKERSAKEKEFQKKLASFRDAAQKAQKELQTKEEEYAGKMMADVQKTTKEYAQKNGYAMILRKGDVIYSDGKIEMTDVTADILKSFDNQPPEAATAK